MSYYVIKHVKTGKLMPQMRRGRGYSHWNPSLESNEVSASLNIPRLFANKRSAKLSIGKWCQGAMRQISRTNSYTGEWEDDIIVKYDGREKGDLELVEIQMFEVLTSNYL